MTCLGINIDHIATIRQLRGTLYPNLVEAARLVARGGAHQLTVHLREDRRHIQDSDVAQLSDANILPLNLEMAAVDDMIEIACVLRPQTATLVPERREELTTEQGLDVAAHVSALKFQVKRLHEAKVKVSCFVDPEEDQIHACQECGATAVELHTGSYCAADTSARQRQELEKLQKATLLAQERGLRVAAGHGLNRENLGNLLRAVPDIVEYNIGHAVVARAIFIGLEEAVRELQRILEGKV